MTKQKREELLDRFETCAKQDEFIDQELILETLQTISSDVSAMINPLGFAFAPFYISAFEQIATAMRS